MDVVFGDADELAGQFVRVAEDDVHENIRLSS